MPFWNAGEQPKFKHVPQPQFELEMPERAITNDIRKFLIEKGWTEQYTGHGAGVFTHPDFSDGPSYYEWHEAVAMEMIRFMRIGVSA